MRCASVLFAGWVLSCVTAPPSRAADGIPVSARGRLNLQMVTTRAAAPWPWDVQSRSPLVGSRFMTDVTAGRDAYGTVYLKGAANWRNADDAAGRVAFVLEQGDYLYRRALGSGAFSLVVFGDERRYFTGELGTVTMDDDAVARFEHRLGVTLAASRGAASADYRISSLENGPAADLMQRGAVRVSSRAVHAAVSYRHIRPEAGRDQAVFQAEVASYYRRVTAVVSYAQSGRGSGFFFPGQSDLPGDIGVGGLADAAPDNAAAGAEARVRAFALGDVRVDAVYRYQLAGAAYVDELAGNRPGSVNNVAELYASHRRYAVDGRLTWRDEKRFVLEDGHSRGLEATGRAFLRDNSQLLLRAAAERREFDGRETYDAGLVQAGYRRDLQRFMGGVHVMLDGIGDDLHPVGAAEARINWSATSALYGRWVVNGEPGRPDAVYARLEFRPSGRTWVTVAYGWALSGDSPYIFDDRDGLPSPDARDAFTVTVRGDF